MSVSSVSKIVVIKVSVVDLCVLPPVVDLCVLPSVDDIKALPDEIMYLIKQWLLPVKPKVCGLCKMTCLKPHLMKSHGPLVGLIKRRNYCNMCWCSRLKCMPFIKIKEHFTDELSKHLYPMDTVIKAELKKRSNKIAGEWRLITNGKLLFSAHKQRKTQEKVVFYERLLDEGINYHSHQMVKRVKRERDLENAPMRKEILSKALAKRFANNQVSYEYFYHVMKQLKWLRYGESEMTAILEKWNQINSITKFTHTRAGPGGKTWFTNEEAVLMFEKIVNKDKCYEFCGYWNTTTLILEYKC